MRGPNIFGMANKKARNFAPRLNERVGIRGYNTLANVALNPSFHRRTQTGRSTRIALAGKPKCFNAILDVSR